jgi:hypothetical protein
MATRDDPPPADDPSSHYQPEGYLGDVPLPGGAAGVVGFRRLPEGEYPYPGVIVRTAARVAAR